MWNWRESHPASPVYYWGVWVNIAMKKGGRIEKSATRVQPEDTANYKCLFFLDVGRMPAAFQDQNSVPHGKLVACEGYI